MERVGQTLLRVGQILLSGARQECLAHKNAGAKTRPKKKISGQSTRAQSLPACRIQMQESQDLETKKNREGDNPHPPPRLELVSKRPEKPQNQEQEHPAANESQAPVLMDLA